MSADDLLVHGDLGVRIVAAADHVLPRRPAGYRIAGHRDIARSCCGGTDTRADRAEHRGSLSGLRYKAGTHSVWPATGPAPAAGGADD